MDLEEWLPYIDEHGFLQDRPNGSSGNGIMYSVYLALLSEEHEIPELIDQLKATLSDCWVPGGGMNRAPKGYWTTYAGKLNQADDYISLGLIDCILSTDYSARLLDVSRNSWGIINNVEPGRFLWKAWIFRMPQVQTHLQLAAQERPGPAGVLVWCLSILWSLTRLRHRDSRIKHWIMVETFRRVNPKGPAAGIMHLTADIWTYCFSRKFPGVGAAEYFAMPHPARTYFWNRLPQRRKTVT